MEQATHLFDLARYLLGEASLVESLAQKNPRPAFPDADVPDVSAALVRFSKGVPGVFSATCDLAGPVEIYVKLICEGSMVTITQQGTVFDLENQKVEKRLGSDPFLTENRAFLKAIQQNDPALLYSSYEDALKTHALCHDVLENYQKKM